MSGFRTTLRKIVVDRTNTWKRQIEGAAKASFFSSFFFFNFIFQWAIIFFLSSARQRNSPKHYWYLKWKCEKNANIISEKHPFLNKYSIYETLMLLKIIHTWENKKIRAMCGHSMLFLSVVGLSNSVVSIHWISWCYKEIVIDYIMKSNLFCSLKV